MEAFVTIATIYDLYGGSVSKAAIRAACRRRQHRLPHIECGSKRPVIKIRPSVFEQWLQEEMNREGLAGVDNRTGQSNKGALK